MFNCVLNTLLITLEQNLWTLFWCSYFFSEQFVGNKEKGRISRRVTSESKARQISRKTNILYPLNQFVNYLFTGPNQFLLITTHTPQD